MPLAAAGVDYNSQLSSFGGKPVSESELGRRKVTKFKGVFGSHLNADRDLLHHRLAAERSVIVCPTFFRRLPVAHFGRPNAQHQAQARSARSSLLALPVGVPFNAFPLKGLAMSRTRYLSMEITAFFIPTLLLASHLALAADPDGPLAFQVQTEVVHRELSPTFCWFHPRVAAIPAAGQNGKPAVIMTIQQHLVADDHYSGMYFLRTNDLGKNWTKPAAIPELAWQKDTTGATISVADVTPAWHPQTARLLAIGTKVRYSEKGAQLLDRPGSHESAYATFDPKSNQWSAWKMLNVPDTEGKFFLVCPGCVQWLVRPDGSILLPVYFRGFDGEDFSVTVFLCRFDGETLTLTEQGEPLTLKGGRGLVEPSLAFFRGRYFLTLRNDAMGYVSTSDDGLHFTNPKPWKFDDGSDLGSYNTQQHWLTHSAGLFLSYTRRGANNDHIARNRAPLFVAQVDTVTLTVLRATEQVLIPERGVMLGNFGAASITADETWVTDAEFAFGEQPHARGADGSIFAARVIWSKPNQQIADLSHWQRVISLGDSITKGIRPGVEPNQTFSALVQQSLQKQGLPVEVLNEGIGGERTDQALNRLTADVISRAPAIVTIMYGTNDSYVDLGQQKPRISEAEFRNNLEQLVDRLRRVGIVPVLMTEPRWGDAAKPNGVGEHPNLRLQRYVAVCREVAHAKQVKLIDHFSEWSEHAKAGKDIGNWTTDQCHPNPEGHRILADSIQKELRGILSK